MRTHGPTDGDFFDFNSTRALRRQTISFRNSIAGRHTHITELLRNGATLTEARELARHSDLRMTMKYTHIGLKDQAKALSGLPVPKIGRTDSVSGLSISS